MSVVVLRRLYLKAIAMTASDLSASAKPWELQVMTVKVIFEEFYQQGDEERAAGRAPIPMMDRTQPEAQAASQAIALIPNTKPLLDECRANLERWKELDTTRQRPAILDVPAATPAPAPAPAPSTLVRCPWSRKAPTGRSSPLPLVDSTSHSSEELPQSGGSVGLSVV
ncbi:putative 3',5'-cyclic phosphodiesterase pde-5 [Frankliniella fusca]|uniref:3',5'-cyclic phosphodiesterase pde-5 n=1 Tax=Frankliniella fusca TaxID=407009 RepID=A0AAE1HLF9_9NEOP|nr:putative 3',5'-cyclic phosphodiesterase pde-5 [Frankliniella fusca]